MTERIERQNKTLGEKENYKYLEILEADTINYAEMKERIKNKYFRKTRNFSKSNYIAEISSKRCLGFLLRNILETSFIVDQRRFSTNRSEN